MIFWFLFEILLILEKGVDILDVNNLFIFIVANNLSESYLYIKWEFNQTLSFIAFTRFEQAVHDNQAFIQLDNILVPTI